jgi:hypothetical protein
MGEVRTTGGTQQRRKLRRKMRKARGGRALRRTLLLTAVLQRQRAVETFWIRIFESSFDHLHGGKPLARDDLQVALINQLSVHVAVLGGPGRTNAASPLHLVCRHKMQFVKACLPDVTIMTSQKRVSSSKQAQSEDEAKHTQGVQPWIRILKACKCMQQRHDINLGLRLS